MPKKLIIGLSAMTLALLIINMFGVGTPASAATAEPWTNTEVVSTTQSFIGEVNVLSDDEGNLTSIWLQYVASKYVLMSASKEVGSSWSTPVAISPSDQDASNTKLTIDESGNLTALWRSVGNSNSSIFSASKPVGGVWSAPEILDSSGIMRGPTALIVDRFGTVTAVWAVQDGSALFLRSSSKPYQGNWSTPVVISSTATSNTGEPDLVVDSEGTVTAIWDQSSGVSSVHSATRFVDGTWAPSLQLSAAGLSSYRSDIAIDGSGKAFAMWNTDLGSNLALFSSTKSRTETWSSAISENELGDDYFLMDLVSDLQGNLTVLVSALLTSPTTVDASSRLVGDSWSTKVPLSSPSDTPDIAKLIVDEGGNLTAVWQLEFADMFASTTYSVQTTNRPFGGTWSDSIILSSLNTDMPRSSLWMGGAGQVIASWLYRSNADFEIQYATMAWEYNLTYNVNSGSGVSPVNQVSLGGVPIVVATGSTLTRPGFVFTGWNTRADGRGTSYAAGTSIQLYSDTTLYAQWTPELAETGNDRNVVNITAGIAGALLLSGLVLLARRRILN